MSLPANFFHDSPNRIGGSAEKCLFSSRRGPFAGGGEGNRWEVETEENPGEDEVAGFDEGGGDEGECGGEDVY